MKGFTVVEAIVSCAVIAIVATLAWPSFASLLAGQRVVATTNALVSALQTARHASIVERAVTVACPDDDGRCGDDWSVGWVVFAAPPRWTASDPVPGPTVLYVGAPVRGTRVVANRRAFRFRPHGRSTNGTLVICGPQPRAVVISVTGRVRSGRADPAAC